MSSVAQRLMTAEEFWQTVNDKYHELVRGEVVETMPTGGEHGEIALALGTLLRLWVKQGIGGYAGTEAGFILAHDPDIVRGPAIAYVRRERIPPGGVPKAFWTIAPDLAVEIVSPSETIGTVREKLNDFLAAGTALVWTIHPEERVVVAYTPDGLARTYREDDILEHPDVLPGFACKVVELFL